MSTLVIDNLFTTKQEKLSFLCIIENMQDFSFTTIISNILFIFPLFFQNPKQQPK